MAPITIAGRQGDLTGSLITEVRGGGPKEVMDAIDDAANVWAAARAAATAGPSSSSEISASISAPPSHRDAARMEKQRFEAMTWEQTSASVQAGIRGSIGGSMSTGGLRRPGFNRVTLQPLENHDRGLMLHCITAAKVEERGMGNQSKWAQICLKLPAIQELIEGGELEANCCNGKPAGAVVAYDNNHSALIQLIVDAFPDPRQLVLDRWEESGEKLPTGTKPAARFDWMMKQYGYKSEEVQGRKRLGGRPAGWIHDAVMSQMDLQRIARKKEKLSE